ncbi:MAG: hypothetical protein AAF235_05445 [Planctomycetota bacterium]
MSVKPKRRIEGGLAGIADAARRLVANESPGVLARGTAEGLAAPTGSSAPQQRTPDATVQAFSGIIAERRMVGGGAITSDTQVIPAGTRVEYRVKLLYTGRTTDWLLADNDDLHQLPRLAAPIKGRCAVTRWPQSDGTLLVALELKQKEVGKGAECPEPA